MKRFLSVLLPAVFLFAAAAGPASAEGGPSTYVASWQLAGMANIGEPTLRIAYDANYPGARASAMNTLYSFQSAYSYLPQPGVTTGLHEIGYSAHMSGVQLQLFGDNPYVDNGIYASMQQAGIPMTPCWQTPSVCPLWNGQPNA